MAIATSLRRVAQNALAATIRPYTVRELPGWGKLYGIAIGDYRRDWLWADAKPVVIRDKMSGRRIRLDISWWSDRTTYFLGRWYDLETLSLASDLLSPGDTVIDIGANRGMFALAAAYQVGDGGKVICFEPNPKCVSLLKQEIDDNGLSNVTVHQMGLGDKEEVLSLSVPKVNSGEATFGKTSYAETYDVEAVVKVGDVALEDEAPAFIKIDVEGFECRVLSGLRRTIELYSPIILTEMVPGHLIACGSSVDELTKMMSGVGYSGFKVGLKKLNGSYTWKLTEVGDQSISGDVLWMRKEATPRLANLIQLHS